MFLKTIIRKHRILPLLFIPLILFCLSLGCTSSKPKEITYTIPDMSDYRNMEDTEHHFREISFESLIEIFRQKKTAIVWLSRINCMYCQNAVWIMNKAAEDAGISPYYVDAQKPISETGGKEENDRLYDELCGYIYDALLPDETGKRDLYIPLLLNIQNGKLIRYHTALTDSFSLSKSDTLSEEEVQELYDIYRTVIDSRSG